jgi:glycosyltransferase involved in cell wall biosynthesis
MTTQTRVAGTDGEGVPRTAATRPVRILFDHQIVATQRYGGVTRWLLSLLRELNQIDDIWARLSAPAHVNAYIAPGDALHPLSFRLDGMQRGLRYRPRLLEPLFRLATAMSRPDIVHETGYSTFCDSRPRGPRRPRIVTSLHDMIVDRHPDWFGHAEHEIAAKLSAFRRADAIVCVSANTRRDLLDRYPEFESRSHVVWHGVDHATGQQALPAAVVQPYILFVGTRHPYKNFDRLLRAYGASRRLVGEMHLVCFGGGPLTAAEREVCRASGVPETRIVHIEGDDALLAAAYRHAAVFAFPSLYEGFGMPLTEAMVQGCPIACSAASSFPEVAADAAAYFDPLDVESMRSTLETVVFDAAQRARLVEAGKRRVSLFSWPQCAAQTAAIYRQVSGRG